MWKEHYNLGIERIDEQHKQLFERTEKFIATVRQDMPLEDKVEEIEKTLAFMEEYVVTHFADEEKLQQDIDYPKYQEHKKLHNNFKDYVFQFKRNFAKNKNNEDLIMAFSGRLMTWLINHVASEDQKISNYVNKNKGGF